MAGVQVPISYPTNTVDLVKAVDILKQSKTATDQLRSSAKALWAETAASGKQVSSTLEGMNLRLQQLRAQINLTSQSNTAQLQKLSVEYKTLQSEIEKTTKKLFEHNSAIKQGNENWQTMFNTVRLFLTAGIVKEITSITLGMATLKGNIEGVSNAFNKLPNAKLLLQQLKSATHGTTDELYLMQTALKAQNFKIPLEQLGTLLEFANVRAQQTGQSVQYMIDSIVLGLGYNSIRRLDNVGLSVADLKKKMDATGLSLRDAFGLFVQDEIQKMGGYIKTAATDVEILNANLRGLQQTVAKKLETEGIIKFLGDAIKAIDYFIAAGGDPDLIKAFAVQDKAAQQAASSVDKFIRTNLSKLKTDKDIEDAIDIELEKTIKLIRSREDLVKTLQNQLVSETSLIGLRKLNAVAQNKPIKDEIEAIQQRNLELANYIELLKKYETPKKNIVDLEEEEAKRIAQNEALIQESVERFAAITDAQIEHAKTFDEMSESYRKMLSELKPAFDSLFEEQEEVVDFSLNKWREFFVRFKLGMNDSKKTTEQAMRQIKNSIQDTVNTIIQTNINSELAGYDIRIQKAREYYDKIIELAGNNERRKVELQIRRDNELKKLEKQKGEAETRAAKRKVYMESAVAVARAFADYQYPYSLIVAGLVAVSALAQINEINKAPKGYKKGVIGLKGPGTETSDSIPAMLSRNESVMTAEATRNSYKTLHKIQSGKINDRVMEKIIAGSITVVGADDKHTAEKLDELIRITKSNRPPDYVERAGMLYRVKDKGTNSKKYIRSKYGL